MLPWCPLVTMAILLSKCDIREAGFFCNSHPYEVYLVFELLWSADKSSCTGKFPTKSMSTAGLVVLKIRLLDLQAQWIENQKRWVDVILLKTSWKFSLRVFQLRSNSILRETTLYLYLTLNNRSIDVLLIKIPLWDKKLIEVKNRLARSNEF